MSEQSPEPCTSATNSSLIPSTSSCSNAVIRFPSFQFPLFSLDQVPRLSSLASQELQKPTQPHDLETKIKSRVFLKKCRFRSILEPIAENKKICIRRNETVDPDVEIGDMRLDEIYQKLATKYKNRLLCEAVFRNDVECVKTLISSGISPNCHDRHKRTPLHIAVSKGYCELVQLLLSCDADANIKDGLGNSCLHLAACTNNVEMALILIQGGASVHAVDIRGRSPIQLAQSKLRILQQCPDGYIKSKVKQVIDMLLMYLQKGCEKRDNSEETELLSSFQTRLQITESPEQISNEIDNLSKMLNKMGTLAIK